MKRGIITLAFILLLCTSVSAEIIFNNQPSEIYNFGDSISLPVTIKTLNEVTGVFQMDLICNGTAINFYKNGIKLNSGEEKSFDSSLILIRSVVGDIEGLCKIKATLNGDYELTNEFEISNLLLVDGRLEKTEFKTGEGIVISGKITRNNGQNSNGFVEATIISEENLTQSGTINEGSFKVNLSIPTDFKAGIYPVEVRAYERSNDGTKTNIGVTTYNVLILQVPTNLELVFENKKIDPNNFVKLRAILRDQTGEIIEENVSLTIKNSKGQTIKQENIKTNFTLEYLISYDEQPGNWTVSAVSNGLNTEDKIIINKKESVNIEIINRTIIIKNNGNVPYDKTILVELEDEPINVLVKLGVGESKKYIVNGPKGENKVKVSTDNEDQEEVTGVMSLTGGVTGIKEETTLGIIGWGVVILILIVAGIIALKKLYKKGKSKNKMFGLKNNFGGKNFDSGKKDNFKKMTIGEGMKMIPKVGSKAELSLSIKEGDKQDASMVCIKIKGLSQVKTGRGSGAETINKITDLADEHKAVVYENQDYLFLILAPLKTRTFKNDKPAFDLAEKVEMILAEHNRKFNQKIEYGISLNNGSIIAKIENNVFKFMSMGTFMTEAKRIASISRGEILLSEKMNNLLRIQVKTEKSVRDGTSVFSITRVKRENEEARAFINKFMERQKKE